MMNGLVIILFLIAATLSLNLSSPDSLASSQKTSLGFSNFTGSCVTNEQLNTFINFAITARSLYNNYLEKNLVYIKEMMDTYFGNADNTYIVFLQNQSTNDPVTINWYLYSNGGCNIASLHGINIYEPTWSYMFIKIAIPRSRPVYYTDKLSGINGMTQEQFRFINQGIYRNEQNVWPCDCSGTTTFWNQLRNYDNQEWNIFCSSSPYIWGLLPALNNQWLFTRNLQCFWYFYVI